MPPRGGKGPAGGTCKGVVIGRGMALGEKVPHGNPFVPGAMAGAGAGTTQKSIWLTASYTSGPGFFR